MVGAEGTVGGGTVAGSEPVRLPCPGTIPRPGPANQDGEIVIPIRVKTDLLKGETVEQNAGELKISWYQNNSIYCTYPNPRSDDTEGESSGLGLGVITNNYNSYDQGDNITLDGS